MTDKYIPAIAGHYLDIRRNEVICEGTVESVSSLETLISKSKLCIICHDGNKGKMWAVRDEVARTAFSRVYKIQFNSGDARIAFWYDKRYGTAVVKAFPRHMTMLRKMLPGFGDKLWAVAKSGESLTKHKPEDDSLVVHKPSPAYPLRG